MASRDESLMHPELRSRWDWLKVEYAKKYPLEPQPKISCTVRDNAEQQKLYNEKKSNALPGQSLHNYTPCYAFDVFFVDSKGATTWEFYHYERLGVLAESIGLEWGGRWKGLVDGPHFQLPMTYQDARIGKLPTMPPLPQPPEPARDTLETFVCNGLTEAPVIIRKAFIATLDGKPLEGTKLEIKFN
jgi:hypothetical protein